MPKTIVYVDGFNLYYGVLKNTGYKWLDLERFFTLLRQDDEIRAIKYFTALVEPGVHRVRQEAYLNALAAGSLVQTILGRFKRKQVVCRSPGCTEAGRGRRTFQVLEEKRTDVNIAIHMLDDAYRGVCQHQVLVSADSDLVPAIQMVRQRFPEIRTTVYIPSRHQERGAAVELRTAAHRHRTLPLQLLPKTQLPTRVPSERGGFVDRPTEW